MSPTSLCLLPWRKAEEKACGAFEIDADKFFNNICSYMTDERLNWFKEIFREFDQETRRKYLQFVWGRERLPVDGSFSHQIYNDGCSREDTKLPLGETCFFRIRIAEYSNKQSMKEKLIYAINNCVYIDADFNV